MNNITILAMLTILGAIGLLFATSANSALAQTVLDNATMAGNLTEGNLTEGNLTEGNLTEATGTISGGKKCNEAC